MIFYKKTSSDFPKRLDCLEKKPEQLYIMGELPSDDKPSIAIVGARNASSYGKNIAYEYARILASQGIQIVSGLARGIDSAAHAGALEGGGKTFGILGCGIDICYPASSRKLYEKMKEQGGIITEFHPGEAPLAFHFPMRNRLISGLADGILVVEAKEKSGSLITVDCGLEQGKTIFAIPGRVGDLLSDGCNRLIYQGAVPAWKPEIIWEEMEWKEEKRKFHEEETVKRNLVLAREDDLVYSCLDLTPKTAMQLQDETGISYGKLMTSLLHLQESGMAREVWKNHYIRQKKEKDYGGSESGILQM